MKKALAIIVFTLPPLVHAEIYRWVDENGVVNFSNERPDNVQANQSQQRLSNTFVSPTISVADRSASANRQVVMYSAARCKACDQARKYFQENGIAFLEYDIEKSDESRQSFEKLAGISVPLILIDEKPLNGFSIKSFRAHYE